LSRPVVANAGSGLTARDLKLLRTFLGHSLRDIAIPAGLDAARLSRIERGQTPLTPALAVRILRALMPDAALTKDAQESQS
jgi:hypothetical protein